MPINRVSGPSVSVVTPSSPTAPAAPAQPAAPTLPTAPSAPSRFEAVTGRLKGKALEVVMDKVADEHELKQGVNFGLAQGNVKVSEKIALPGTDTFKGLVASDSRRAAHVKGTPEAVWVATRAMAGASASLPLGAGAHLGFSGSVEVTSIMAHEVKGTRDVAGALATQAKSMVLPLDAEGLQGLKAAPGSEWMFRGQVGASGGIGYGANSTLGNGVVSAHAHLGVSVAGSSSDVFTKHVKVLDGDRVFVQVGKQDLGSRSGALGARVGLDVDTGNSALDRLGNEVEKRTRIEASLTGSVNTSEKVLGAAVLDLSTPAGREAYDFIVRSGPTEAAAFIKSQGLGNHYTEANRTTATGLRVQFGSASVLATSTVRGTTTGVLEEPGSTTLLAQADYGRNVGGFLARLTIGEERSVSVRAGSVTKDGETKQGVAVSLSVKDPSLSGEELQQLQRFSAGMGAPLEGLPAAPANGKLGKGEYQVSVALTGDDVAQLRQRSDEDMQFAFAAAHREIAGQAALPPWFEQKATFEWFKGELDSSRYSGDPAQRDRTIATYKEQYGRDLEKDIDSEKAISAIVKQVNAARGEPVEQWGKVLEALGKQPSADVRASALALKRLASADVVSLSVTAGGKTVKAEPQVAAPPTIADVTGPLLNPPT